MRYIIIICSLLLLPATLGFGVQRKMTPAAVAKLYTAKARKLHYQPKQMISSALPKYNSQLIVLDAGHGGYDEGAHVKTFQEKRITLTTTLLTKKYLEEKGYRVLLTRSRDVYLSLPKRVSIANQTQGALFVSVHYNASKNTAASGVEVFYPNSDEVWRASSSKRLASCILSQVIDQTQASSRGVKEGNLHVIRETQMPAVLVEGGFITNAAERALLRDREYLNRVALGIAEGIHKYLKS